MTPILLLSDRERSGTRELLELVLNKSGYEYQVIEVTRAAALSPYSILQQSSKACVLLAHITSSDSPIWSLVEQIRKSQEEMAIPIIAILNFSSRVVGPKYKVWIQYHRLFSDYLVIPLAPDDLMAVLSRTINSGAT